MQFVYMYKALVTLVGPLLKPFSTIDSGESNSAWAGFLCSQGTPPNQTACSGLIKQPYVLALLNYQHPFLILYGLEQGFSGYFTIL